MKRACDSRGQTPAEKPIMRKKVDWMRKNANVGWGLSPIFKSVRHLLFLAPMFAACVAEQPCGMDEVNVYICDSSIRPEFRQLHYVGKLPDSAAAELRAFLAKASKLHWRKFFLPPTRYIKCGGKMFGFIYDREHKLVGLSEGDASKTQGVRRCLLKDNDFGALKSLSAAVDCMLIAKGIPIGYRCKVSCQGQTYDGTILSVDRIKYANGVIEISYTIRFDTIGEQNGIVKKIKEEDIRVLLPQERDAVRGAAP